jgi:hypothetical protein
MMPPPNEAVSVRSSSTAIVLFDEALCEPWENPDFQYFCGEEFFQLLRPNGDTIEILGVQVASAMSNGVTGGEAERARCSKLLMVRAATSISAP